LAKELLRRYGVQHGKPRLTFAPDAVRALHLHRWPGNVRELQNVIERAVILCGDTGTLEPEHLGFSPRAVVSSPSAAAPASGQAAVSTAPASGSAEAPADGVVPLAELEKRHIMRALQQTGQNRTHAAKLLGISVRTLRNKLADYGVTSKDDPTAAKEK
jgi:DNA-binding NtrC family response regulator